MHGAELWCLQASWSRPQLRKPAFTVVVQDTDFFSQSSEHSKTSTLTIRVWLGSYMGIYLKLLQIVQDQRKALRTAEKVSPLLCIRNMLEFIIKPDVFATRPLPQKGGYYVCLASPGLGKTVEKLIPAIVDCINFGELCILTGTLNSVSNHHVQLLKDRLPTSHFEERVRVEGARGSDVLSKSMMLEALTWKLMKPAVEQYEKRMVQRGSRGLGIY